MGWGGRSPEKTWTMVEKEENTQWVGGTANSSI